MTSCAHKIQTPEGLTTAPLKLVTAQLGPHEIRNTTNYKTQWIIQTTNKIADYYTKIAHSRIRTVFFACNKNYV